MPLRQQRRIEKASATGVERPGGGDAHPENELARHPRTLDDRVDGRAHGRHQGFGSDLAERGDLVVRDDLPRHVDHDDRVDDGVEVHPHGEP